MTRTTATAGTAARNSRSRIMLASRTIRTPRDHGRWTTASRSLAEVLSTCEISFPLAFRATERKAISRVANSAGEADVCDRAEFVHAADPRGTGPRSHQGI